MRGKKKSDLFHKRIEKQTVICVVVFHSFPFIRREKRFTDSDCQCVRRLSAFIIVTSARTAEEEAFT